jgi:hypothetical protein
MHQTIYSKVSLVFVGALLLSAASTTPAQSLGEVARQCRKERGAREKKGEVPVKVFTNDDIARMPPISILKSSMQAPSSPETKLSAPAREPGAAAPKAPVAQSGKPTAEEVAKSREYWRARFKAAHAHLAHAKEEQTLVEEELRLLQIQQARELNPDRSRKLNGQIDASTVELEAKRAATEKARSEMERLENEFKESGEPQHWLEEGAKPE